MSFIKKDPTQQSERLLEINWRGDENPDSTRNPVVDASRFATGEAEAEEVFDFEVVLSDEAFEGIDFPDTTINDTSISSVFDVVVEAATEAEPDLVADQEEVVVAFDFPELRGSSVSVRMDEVFRAITAYCAVVDNGIAETSLLGRSLLSQANALFNTAFLNLQARLGYIDVFADTPGSAIDGDVTDITTIAISEVLRLQRLAA